MWSWFEVDDKRVASDSENGRVDWQCVKPTTGEAIDSTGEWTRRRGDGLDGRSDSSRVMMGIVDTCLSRLLIRALNARRLEVDRVRQLEFTQAALRMSTFDLRPPGCCQFTACSDSNDSIVALAVSSSSSAALDLVLHQQQSHSLRLLSKGRSTVSADLVADGCI